MGNIARVGTAHAEPGQRSTGWIKVGEIDQLGFARGELRIPVVLVNGARSGPALALIAGQHPGEYVGMRAAIEIARGLDPCCLAGSVVALPVLNPYGVRQKVPYICPFDGLNMNRLWPGFSGGTVGQRTTHAIWEQLLRSADYVIDMHGGDFPEYQADYAIHFDTGNEEADKLSREMARHFLAPYTRRSPRSEGGNQTGPAARMAMELLGTPAIVTEVGDAGSVDAQRLKLNIDGVLNILRYLQMIPGTPIPPPDTQREMVSRTPVLCKRSGLSHHLAALGDSVRHGTPIAKLTDSVGNELELITSPCEGDIVQLFYQGWMNEGEIIAKIAGLARR